MTIWFLAFLALIWIAFFLPGAERARRQTPLAAALRFKRAMHRVAPAKRAPRHRKPRRTGARKTRPAAQRARTDSGRWIIVPKGAEPSGRAVAARQGRRRRRRLLVVLLVFVIASAAVAIWRGGSWLELQLIADGVLIFYLAMLFETKRRRDERRSKVLVLDDGRADDLRVLDPVAGGNRT